MNADLLNRALDELVERCDDSHGDWDEVLRRASIMVAAPVRLASPMPMRRPASTRRRALIALAVALLIFGVLLATPAFGVRDAILGLFGRTNVPFKSGKPAPTLIRRQFSDLNVGAPPSLAPQAVASESREVTTFHVNGKSHTLWVAPTRHGGFCWDTSEGPGGCLNLAEIEKAYRQHPNLVGHGAIHPELVSVTYLMKASIGKPNADIADLQVAVLTPKAVRLVAEFRGGKTFDLPFVFVSKPINAGFAYWHIPDALETAASELAAVAVYDGQGRLLAREPTPTFRPVQRFPVHIRPSQIIKSPPPSPLGSNIPRPTAPLRHGSGDGVSITVGSNGVVVFNTVGLDAARRALLRGSFGVDCFHLSHDALGLFPQGTGVIRSFGPEIKIQLFGVPKPYDGCEIQATYGHTWPDKLDSHSAVEVPLSNAGRRFFTDRAAARNLALFVRSQRARKLRHESGQLLENALLSIGPRLTRLDSTASPIAIGKIGYIIANAGVTFVEQSPTGKRFTIVIADGRIIRENVKPYAFVF